MEEFGSTFYKKFKVMYMLWKIFSIPSMLEDETVNDFTSRIFNFMFNYSNSIIMYFYG